MTPTIYHGTPLTPRAALRSLAGRAFCVSFWRPDDTEVVEAISPTIMFRQRRLLGMAGCDGARRTLVRARGLVSLLRLARGTAFSPRSLGGHTRRARRTLSAQRRASERLAFRSVEGGAALAHGRPDRPLPAACRSLRPSLSRLDRRVRRADGQGKARAACGRVRALVPPHGRAGAGDRQCMARDSHDARCAGRTRISLWQRRRNVAGAEWAPL